MAVPAHLVHVFGVNDRANREDLRDIFSRHANVVGVDLIGKGSALVGYAEEEEALYAIQNLKFEVFEGRILKLQKSTLFTPEYLRTIQDHNYGICLKYFFCYNWNVYVCLNALPGEICLRGKHSCFYCFVRDGELRAHRNRDEECPSRTRGWQDMPQFSSAEIRKSAIIPQTGGQPRQPGPVNRAPTPINRAPTPINRAPTPINRAPTPINRAPTPINRAPTPINRAPTPVEQSQSGTTTSTDQPRNQQRFKFKDTGNRPTSSLLSKFEGIMAGRTREELEPVISNLGDIRDTIRVNAGPDTRASGRQENQLVETGGGDQAISKKSDKCSHVTTLSREDFTQMTRNPSCDICHQTTRTAALWMCLFPNCYMMGCSATTVDVDHSSLHFDANKDHYIQIHVSSQAVWCYRCGGEVYLSRMKPNALPKQSPREPQQQVGDQQQQQIRDQHQQQIRDQQQQQVEDPVGGHMGGLVGPGGRMGPGGPMRSPVPSPVPPPVATSQRDDTFQRCGTGTLSSLDIADSEPWGYNPHVNHNPACVSGLGSHDSQHFSTGGSIVNDFPRTSYAGNYSTNVEGEQDMMGPGGPGMEPPDIFSTEPEGFCPRLWRFLPKEPERTQHSMNDITNLYANSSKEPERTQPSVNDTTNLYANSSSSLYKDNTSGPAQGRLKSISSLGDSFGNSSTETLDFSFQKPFMSTLNKKVKPTQSSSSTMSRMSDTQSRPINVSGIKKLNKVNTNWYLPRENRTGSVLGPITKYTGAVSHSPVFRPGINSSPVSRSDSMGGVNWGGNHGSPWMSGPVQSHPWDDGQSHHLDDGFHGGVGENWAPVEDNIWEEDKPVFY